MQRRYPSGSNIRKDTVFVFDPALTRRMGLSLLFSREHLLPRSKGGHPDKTQCLSLDRTCTCVTKYVAFWMTKWAGANSIGDKQVKLI